MEKQEAYKKKMVPSDRILADCVYIVMTNLYTNSYNAYATGEVLLSSQ